MITKEENNSLKKEIVVSGEQALKVAEALTATTMKMLQLLWQESLRRFNNRQETRAKPSLHKRTSKNSRRTKTAKHNLRKRQKRHQKNMLTRR